CGGAHSYQNCPATSENVYRDNIQEYVSQAAAANYNQGNTSFRPQMVANQIRPPGFPPVQTHQNNQNNLNQGKNFNQNQGGNFNQGQLHQPKVNQPPAYQAPAYQAPIPQTQISEPVVAPVSASMPNLKPSIPYPSRRDNERRRDQANEQIEKFYEIFKDMRIDEYLALADLGASINLMPLFVWEGLSLSELTPTCMILELADRSVSKPIGIAKDVSVKVGWFHFPADFMVVDFEPDPRVPLILKRCFLKTGRALIDVHKGELTLRIRNEAITYNLDQTVLGFFDITASGNPTPYDDLIVSTTSPTLTPFGDNDFLLFEEADAFLSLEDDPNSPEFNPFYYD
nr:reverse transcriptase domain-containing protein [Tanacetum cinerariifolium]